MVSTRTKSSKTCRGPISCRNPIVRTPSANRFSVLAEPDASARKREWTFNFLPNSTQSARRGDSRGEKHGKIKIAAPKEQHAPRGECTSHSVRTLPPLHLNNRGPALIPHTFDHTAHNNLAKPVSDVLLDESVRNHWAPQFRPNTLPAPTTVMAKSMRLGEPAFPARPGPCVSPVKASTPSLGMQGKERKESRFFPSASAPIRFDPDMPCAFEFRFSAPKPTNTEPYQSREPTPSTSSTGTKEAAASLLRHGHTQTGATSDYSSPDNFRGRQQPELIAPLPPRRLFTLEYTRSWTEPSAEITIFKPPPFVPLMIPAAPTYHSTRVPKPCLSPTILTDTPKPVSLPIGDRAPAFPSPDPETWRELDKFLNTGHTNPCWCSRQVETGTTVSNMLEIPQLPPKRGEQASYTSDVETSVASDAKLSVNTGRAADFISLLSSPSLEAHSDFEDLYDQRDQSSQEGDDWSISVIAGNDDRGTLPSLITSPSSLFMAPSQTSGDTVSEPDTEEVDFCIYTTSGACSSVESFEILEEHSCKSCPKGECIYIMASTSAVEWPTPHEAASVSQTRNRKTQNETQSKSSSRISRDQCACHGLR